MTINSSTIVARLRFSSFVYFNTNYFFAARFGLDRRDAYVDEVILALLHKSYHLR